MRVSNLQQFLRLLAPPLAAAGLNQTAERSVTGSLESLAAALEPFHDLTTDQLADLVRLAREYRDTGQIPEWALGRKPAAAKPRAPRAPKAPKLTPEQAVALLRDLQNRAHELSPEQVAHEVGALASLTVKELQDVQRAFLGTTIGRKKDDLLSALRKRIDDYAASRDRVQGILVH